jgi:Flp pilus assembly protein TadG
MMVMIMKIRARSEVLVRWRRSVARLRRDASGLAAVEFAMILPLLLVMLFGMVDVSLGVATDRKVTMVAQTLSDLASRYATVTETDFTNFFVIADAMLTPFDKTPLVATISQVYLDPASKTAKVQWSRGDAMLAKNTVVPVPTDLIGKDSSGNYLPNQYLILSQVTYPYKPIIGWVVPKAGLTLSESTYTRPRQTTCVQFPTDCAP